MSFQIKSRIQNTEYVKNCRDHAVNKQTAAQVGKTLFNQQVTWVNLRSSPCYIILFKFAFRIQDDFYSSTAFEQRVEPSWTPASAFPAFPPAQRIGRAGSIVGRKLRCFFVLCLFFLLVFREKLKKNKLHWHSNVFRATGLYKGVVMNASPGTARFIDIYIYTMIYHDIPIASSRKPWLPPS